MTKKLDVCYYVLVDDELGKQIAEKIGAAGFFTVLHPVDPHITLDGAKIGIGIGTGDLHVVDLGVGTIEAAKFILEKFPNLHGMVFVVEPAPTVNVERDGLVSVTRESLIDHLSELAKK
ncbi:MAG: hypothetical protein CO113_14790 [Elusimicrobia bacterium CG_4_9_14_3_um_filter_62_55]|nr:MAG: hypothetical protein COR54_00040 [Elusimicrobia bacterium CG22_combo_CG10-13_8_21_14_all_63_91]PJA18405.1 MAG: hypothetical protein COX66_01260 [Elusimicrobia bacterium CG_4_10_14_0_2_um_filter_63_34]PJB24246.1 MAG: hypothetical protein CO113_14790 [Elusimicrobia bacterium CG_4_9_14_3_um_filter_62_55]